MNQEQSPLATSTGDERAPTSAPPLWQTLNPFRVQRGTFVTLRSASECEQILVEHTRHPALIGQLVYHRRIKRKEPIYEGFANDNSFNLRASKRWIKGSSPALAGKFHEGEDGTTIEVRLRVPVVEAMMPLFPLPMMIVMALLYGDAVLLVALAPMALAFASISTWLLWLRRNSWDEYAWFLETFLNAKQVSYESRPF